MKKKIVRTVQDGLGKDAQFFIETVAAPDPGTPVTFVGKVPDSYDGDNPNADLDNVPVDFGGRVINLPARAIEACVTRVPCEAPKRANEPQAP